MSTVIGTHSRQQLSLPVEVLLQILESLDGEDRVATLLHCAITSRTVLHCARSSLYGFVTLTGYTVPKARLLSRTLNEDPSLGALVKSLVITRTRRVENASPVESLITSGLLPFHLLTNLRDLTIARVLLKSPQDLIEIFGVLPHLERFACDLVYAGKRSSLEGPVDPSTTQAFLGPLLPLLKHIEVSSGEWDHASIAQNLLEERDGAQAGRKLEAIHALAPGVGGVLAWVPVICAARAQLHTLIANVTDAGPYDLQVRAPPWALALADQHAGGHHAYLLDAISQCSSLRFLHLHHIPATFPFGASSDFLSLLDGLLGRRPAPLPALEHLTLNMVDREGCMVSVTDESRHRLAESLLDKRRYPAFRALTLRVQPQKWVYHTDTWSSNMSETVLNALEDALVERWRAAFDALGRNPDVRLDVTMERPRPRPQI
ncbi:hypothetical protein C8Q77DRAFT_1162329 [Trametes polyzona]|nr:hypothetical protein C8Q77DRAFT_1162329 [Trametes polyzona]